MKRGLAVAGGALAALLAVLLLLPSFNLGNTPLSAYGSADDDASLLVNGLQTQGFQVQSLLLGPTALAGLGLDDADAVYLAVGVDRGYSSTELDALWAFMDAGGHAIVLDDTGASEALLRRAGVARETILLSTTGGEPSVVPATIRGLDVDLWEPAGLDVRGSDVTVMARTSNLTAKDLDGDGQAAPEEPTCAGGCVVAFETRVGAGRLVFVGDTTFATNKYAPRSGAVVLLQRIAAEATTGRRALVIVDESRHIVGPPEVGLTLFRTLLLPLTLPIVPWALAAVIVALTIVSVVRRSRDRWADHDPAMDTPYLAPGALDALTAKEGGP